MRIIIIGVGAMGSLFAGRLSPLTEVVMLGHWPEQLAALKGNGLLLVHPDGQESRVKVQATNNLADVGRADIVLVLVKSWQTRRAAGQARQIINAGSLVVTLQNGLGNLEILVESVSVGSVTLGVTSEGANMVAPGIVKHAGFGQTHLATLDGQDQNLDQLADLFCAAGFESHLVNSTRSLVWGKLAVNAGINPLTGLLQVSNGFLTQDTIARDLMRLAAEETAVVAVAQGIGLPYSSAADRALEVAEATAANRSSMAQDLARGTPTEIEAISGAIVESGKQFACPTPINEALCYLVKAQIQDGRWRDKVDDLRDQISAEFRALAQLEVAEWS
jgi:2-dehydropantoate 2-reductase